ncbi:MAG: hypothetical protein ACRDPK_16300 [Carbonactinosporaceae bacterium]
MRNTMRGLAKLALVVAGIVVLGSGTAVAANLITSADIKNQTIRSWDISEGGVGGSEVRNGGVHTEDIATDSVGSLRLTQGVRDKLNAPRLAGHEVAATTQDFGPNGIGGAWCEDPNKVAIAGGAQFSEDDVANDVAVRASWPYTADPTDPDDRNGWKIQVNAPPNVDPGDVTVYAVCVSVN